MRINNSFPLQRARMHDYRIVRDYYYKFRFKVALNAKVNSRPHGPGSMAQTAAIV
jgi:hypothetical protein